MAKRPKDAKPPTKKPSTRADTSDVDEYKNTSFSKKKIDSMSDSLYARRNRGELDSPSTKKLNKDYNIKQAQRDSADAVNKLKKIRKSKPKGIKP